jgi:hypothetical protein
VNLRMCKMLSSTSPSTLLPLQCFGPTYLLTAIYTTLCTSIHHPGTASDGWVVRYGVLIILQSNVFCLKTYAELGNGTTWRIFISCANIIAIAL